MAEQQPNTSRERFNDSEVSSPRSSFDSRSSHSRRTSVHIPRLSATSPHRQSFSESRRVPPSPHTRRQPSLTQNVIQSLIDRPPARGQADPAFAGRDWGQISIGELVSQNDLRFVEEDTGIEEATERLINHSVHVLLIREKAEDTSAICTFDYADLNSYLLLVVGLQQPPEDLAAAFQAIAKKAQAGEKIPLKDVKALGSKEPLTTLSRSTNLIKAVEVFGSGVHRIVVLEEGSDEVVGIVSQSRLVKFLWENGRSFPKIDELYSQSLRDLSLGSHAVISINGEKPLSQALQLMHTEGISSLAVVDNNSNVIGNISTVDVQLLTQSSSFPLLHNTCINFISVILSTRGVIEGKDSFPVFHVNPTSTLAHTVAKLVATKSHRLWVTDPHSPGPGSPLSHSAAHLSPSLSGNEQVVSPPLPSPSVVMNTLPASHHPPGVSHSQAHPQSQNYGNGPTLSPPMAPSMGPTIGATGLPGTGISGRLVGVVSQTDILNLYARASGLSPLDPAETRSRRRRSSSSSISMKKSGDVGRELGLR